MIDRIELNMGMAEDCDGNDAPDVCDFPLVAIQTPEFSPLDGGIVHQFIVPNAAPALGDVTLTLRASGDLNASPGERITIRIAGQNLSPTLFAQSGFQDCAFTAETDTLTISEATWNGLVTGNDLVIDIVPSSGVNGTTCPESFIQATLGYRPVVDDDCNANGRSL